MESNVSPPSPPPPPPPVPPVIPGRLPAAAPRKATGWKITVFILAVMLGLSLLVHLGFLMDGFVQTGVTHRTDGPMLDEVVVENNHSENKIAVVPIEGIITSDMFDGSGHSLVEFVRDQLKRAGRDEDVKAVLLKVDSPGGEVLASDEISNTIADFQKKTGKPVIASMGSVAASGGYYVSAPCRWIVANELTLTGSIGVIMHSLNYRGLMDKVGLRPEVYKSGRFKDMLRGSKTEGEITPEERAMLQRLIDETFEKFKSVVARGRDQANQLNEANKDSKGRRLQADWAEYADGRVLSGKEAHALGFVDELGNEKTAYERALKLARIRDADLIQYRRIFDLSNLFRFLGQSEAARIKVDVGLELPKLKAGQLYFLSPTFIQ